MSETRAATPNVAAGAHARYTLCGEPAAEARVVQDLSRLATGIDSEVGDKLRALMLAGPFARAEGGIADRAGEPHAEEPGYQLLALFRHKPERRQRALDMMAATWTRLLGADVAIRALSVRELAEAPPTRFWFHAGRRQLITLVGDPTLIGEIASYDASELRWDEAVFTLCEHLSALALATLEAPNNEALAVERMQRAALACGDALLLWRGQYADAFKARIEALSRVCTSAALRAAYVEAVAWSARPDLWTNDHSDLQTWLESTRRALATWYLDFEAERIGSARDLVGYVGHHGRLCVPPGEIQQASRPRLTSVLLQHVPALSNGVAQPLERLLRCSVALAFGPHLLACRQQAARLLHLPAQIAEAPSDAALALALRELASHVLDDRLGRPFAACPRAPSNARA
jgi:hypothetical protein